MIKCMTTGFSSMFLAIGRQLAKHWVLKGRRKNDTGSGDICSEFWHGSSMQTLVVPFVLYVGLLSYCHPKVFAVVVAIYLMAIVFRWNQ